MIKQVLFKLFLVFMLSSVQVTRGQNYVPLMITSGFNQDVIAENSPASNYTTAAVDAASSGVNNAFMSINYLNATVGLPANGLITSIATATAGLTFQLAPYNGNNVLIINGNGGFGTLVLQNTTKFNRIFILATSGSADSSFTGTITFTDGATQTISSQNVPDWYSNGAPAIAIQGIGRVPRTGTQLPDNNTDNPKLFQVSIAIDAVNQNKIVQQITLTKTNSSGVLNVFAVSGEVTPKCIQPDSLNAKILNSTSASLNWSNIGNVFDVKWGLEGFDVNTAGALDTNFSNGSTLSGLTPNTNYSFYVRQNCGAVDGVSRWAGPFNFRTPCVATGIPYDIDVTSTTTLPDCITVQNVNNDSKTWATSAKPSSGFVDANVMKYSYHSSNTADDWFYTQGLNLVAGQSYRLKFKYGDSGWVEKLRVSYGSATVNTDMTTELFMVTTGTSSATVEKVIDFIPTTTGIFYIGFQAYSDANKNTLYVGDISVEVSPSCIEPKNVTAGHSVNGFGAYWQLPTTSATSFEYELRTSGAMGSGSVGLVDAGTLPPNATDYQFVNSSLFNNYTFFIKAICSASDSSNVVSASTNGIAAVLNNDKMRVGNGTVSSIGSTGVMNGPYYYNTNTNSWFKLTYDNQAFNNSFGVNGDGTNEWNINGDIATNFVLQNMVFDYSNYVSTGANKGYGVISVKGNITINNNPLEVTYTYNLGQNNDYILVTCSVKNIGTNAVTNVRSWLGTADDFVGTSDAPTKTRGNAVGGNFVPINNSIDRSRFIKVESNQEGAFFYTTHPKANTIIADWGDWYNRIVQTNPTTSLVTNTNDGSYAVYVRLNDLQPNESDEFEVYYAAGLLEDINEVISQVINASGSIDNITSNSAVFKTTPTQDVNGYYIIVPSGSPLPSSTEIINGQNYRGVTLVTKGDSPITANQLKQFTLINLTPNTNYDLYYVNQKNVNGAYFTSPIVALSFSTLEALNITFQNTDVNCYATPTGTSEVVVTGGLPPYSYLWSNNSTAQQISQLMSGTYSITVTDANGEIVTETTTINQPTALGITPSKTDVLCHGASTGKANVDVSGGVTPYSYSWDNGITSTTNEATDLSAGTYTVTVTDANGCTITEFFTITEPTALSITPSQTDVLCHGASTGKASVVVSGGVIPYRYSWDNGITSTTNEATDLSAGTYKVTVTDVNGCTITETFTITEPTALSITPTQTDVLCHGASTGTASVVVSGGVIPYRYSWDNGITSTTNEATDLSAGTYKVTVTDANGCTKTETFTITEPTALSITPNQTDVLCHGASTGKANVAVSGGITPYSYSWDNGITSTTNEVTDLSAGTYTVTVTDANGCTITETFTITEPTALSVIPSQTDVLCHGALTGKANVVVTGGIAPYSYSWDNGFTTSSIDNLKAGVYTVTITDANGCSQTQKITITEPALVPAPSSSQPTQNFCKDENKALVHLNITGTNIQWYDSATGGTALSLNTLLTSKTYYASQIVNGCESPSRKAITVNIYEALPLTSSSVTVCYNSVIQEVSIDGRPSGELKWYTNSSDTRALNPTQLLTSGTYYVSTFVHNLCESARRAVQVTVLPSVPLPGTSQQVVCGSGTVADLTAQSISGAVLKWYSTAQSATPLAPTTNLLNGTYYVEQEVNGCRSGRKAVAVRVVSLPAPSMTNFVLCEGATVDNLQMAPTSVNYVWFTDATTSIMLPRHHTLTTGYYYVAYESLGCISKRTRVHVKINARPVAPTGAVRQHFTTKSMVSNIKVNESNVVWYASYEDAVSGTNAFSNQHPLEDQTTYYGVLVSKEGCTSYPLAVQVTVTLGLNDFDLASLKYYPNPVTSELTVTYKDVIEQLDVYDLTGKWVKTQTYTSNLVKMNLYDLALGTYMVRIKTNEGEQFIKIVKK